MPAHIPIVSDEIARARQQVGEVERARRLLERLIPRRGAGELLLQTRREIGVCVPLELLEVGEQRVARRQDVRARDVLAELVAAALSRSRQAAIAHEIHQARFPPVEIAIGK